MNRSAKTKRAVDACITTLRGTKRELGNTTAPAGEGEQSPVVTSGRSQPGVRYWSRLSQINPEIARHLRSRLKRTSSI